jgi:hypothetical protein
VYLALAITKVKRVGIVFVNKNTSGKFSGKATKTGCVILLSFVMVCCRFSPTPSPTAKIEPALATTITLMPVIVPSLTATLEPKVALRENIIQALGSGNRNLSRLIKISYSDPEQGDITITWAINNNLSHDSIKSGMQNDVINILKAIDHSKFAYIFVVLSGSYSMYDQNGNMAEMQVVNFGFNKSAIDKISWENFQSSDIYNLADTQIIHPLFQ